MKRLVACMLVTVGQVELVNTRTQGNSKGEILEPRLKIMSAIKGHTRGSYKSRPASANSGKLVSSVVRSVEFKQQRYFELMNGNLILEE